MNRFSVLYQFKGQYHHIGRDTQAEARTTLQILANDARRTPIGIFDSKTELFEWTPSYQQHMDQASISEQGSQGNEIISIAQALRRRDASWHPADRFRRPSFFA
ncbi:hypothetical protein ACFQ4C_17280 [Larkinella insperata]|uniref:Uncharacterized protein n=1 Tax=Larkinella insperata TaxID=332158 RepID=A0ABW3QBF7_9BACT|nr:hypothetical protein [Larkinella insperata]